eukprot:jgi/Pico_ML_1/55419/g1105.t1
MEALRATKEAVEGRRDVHGAVGALLEAKEGRIGAEGAADVMWLLHAEDLARHGDEMEKKERANRTPTSCETPKTSRPARKG